MKLLPATWTACRVARWTVSYSILVAVMADFSAATAASDPTGALCATLSSSVCTRRLRPEPQWCDAGAAARCRRRFARYGHGSATGRARRSVLTLSLPHHSELHRHLPEKSESCLCNRPDQKNARAPRSVMPGDPAGLEAGAHPERLPGETHATRYQSRPTCLQKRNLVCAIGRKLSAGKSNNVPRCPKRTGKRCACCASNNIYSSRPISRFCTLSYRIRCRLRVVSGTSRNNLGRIMLRRTFIWGTPGSILAIGLAVSGCTTTGTSDASGHQTDKRHTIDAGVDSTLARDCQWLA